MYAYKLQGLTEEYVCFFGPEYFEGKMYKLMVITTPRIVMGAVNKFVQYYQRHEYRVEERR